LEEHLSHSERIAAERLHEIEVLQDMTELLDSLTEPEHKREVLSFLAARVGGRIYFSDGASRGSNGPAYKNRRS